MAKNLEGLHHHNNLRFFTIGLSVSCFRNSWSIRKRLIYICGMFPSMKYTVSDGCACVEYGSMECDFQQSIPLEFFGGHTYFN